MSAAAEHIPVGTWETHDEAATFALGTRVGAALTGGEIILLDGPLGAGKTIFVKGLAAALGVPVVALYGPTSPRLIGPWPLGGLAEPWDHAGTVQRRGNVWVVQNPLPCLPCEKLGCEGHLESYSRCLDELPVRSVLRVVDEALAIRRPGFQTSADRP